MVSLKLHDRARDDEAHAPQDAFLQRTDYRELHARNTLCHVETEVSNVMMPRVSLVCAVILMLGAGLSAPSHRVQAQACGCGETFVLVGNQQGEAVKGVTVEILREGVLEKNCLDRTPAKQVGRGRKFRFIFSSYESVQREVLLRVTAPGYVTVEYKGNFMTGCGQQIDVTLIKTDSSDKRD